MSAPSNKMAAIAKAPMKDRMIPWYFVLAFMVVFAVNGLFVYLATSTNYGVVTEHAYKKGLNYNQTLSQVERQKALGWKSDILYSPERSELRFELRDAQGAAIRGGVAEVQIARPMQPELEQVHKLDEMSAGVYVAPIALPMQGQWDATVNILWNKQQYQKRQRLVVQ